MKTIWIVWFAVSLISCNKTSNTSTPYKICDDQIVASTKNGYTKNYFPNSINLESIGHYVDGKKNGFWKFFYRNGKIKAEGHYQYNVKQGYWKEYYKNGNVKSEGHIDNCKPSGYWKFYDQKNNLIKETNY
ncbi:toxin-antitoxin system YwqK family antitoxin [Aquimarina litoralis]|uniref:toxin-antitoxin system YwqK family antitoxin n=1 Tax=Aquimarina litoralis TaxID=584605 RepID=UPI001C586B80|nr:hypothetical protein [Aquimarina litoralis]MBW1299104.1 hypothetical protein [Aquimarina litoralis]